MEIVIIQKCPASNISEIIIQLKERNTGQKRKRKIINETDEIRECEKEEKRKERIEKNERKGRKCVKERKLRKDTLFSIAISKY